MLAHRRRLRAAHGPAHRARVATALLVGLALAGCGPSAEITSLTPSEVMSVSAWLTARVTGAQEAVVSATAPGAAEVVTPSLPVDHDSVTVALLGMRADTDYEVTVHAIRHGGDGWSEPMTFHTGSLPAGLPTMSAHGDYSLRAKTLLGVVDPIAAAHAAIIVDGDGQVIWYHVTDHPVTDFQRQPDGTYTACELSPGDTHFDQFDREGRLLRVWTAPPESAGTDWHEIRMLPGGQALLWGAETRTMDLSAMGGRPAAAVVGNVLYRVQPDGVVLFRWSAFDHLAIDDIDPAVDVTQGTVDWTHADAIDAGTDGTYLLTFRNLSQVVKISADNGDILWRLGGKRSTFTFPDDPLGGPSFPHGARMTATNTVLLFDNGNGRATRQSRAVEYSLDEPSGQARLLLQDGSSAPRFSPDMGFAQRTFPNTLVTYSADGYVEEINSVISATPLWTLQLDASTAPIYRAVRVNSLY